MRHNWKVKGITGFSLILASSVWGLCQGRSSWPIVQSAARTFDFANGQRADVSFDVNGPDGQILYRLECHNWTYDQDPGFDYSGDFECRLTPTYEKTKYSTLLTDDPEQSRDWESRGRFLVPELLGKCAAYPEYGRLRTFRLRGMRLRLELTNLRFSTAVPSVTGGPRGLSSFRFVIKVQPDPNAQTPIAAIPSVAEPPPDCGPGYRASTRAR